MATQRWPTAWLMTDERLGEALDSAMKRAAASGAGILLRHYRSTLDERHRLASRALDLGAPLAVARDVSLAQELGLFVHNPGSSPGSLPFSLSVHNFEEAAAAKRRGAALVFVSPVKATRSHPGAEPLGEEQALRLARASGCPAIALGGMNARSGAAMMQRGFAGWAGIDCWR